jgi:hypothetical protein
VDVIGVSLGLVVLDEQARTLDPVVVGLPRRGAAGPQERQGVEPRPGVLGRFVGGARIR